MAEWSPAVLAHFERPRGAGRPDGAVAFRHGRGGWVKKGAVVELWLRCEQERVVEARYEAYGCPATIASASWLCEYLSNRPVEQARALAGLDIAGALALPPEKIGVALIAEDALKQALDGDKAPSAAL